MLASPKDITASIAVLAVYTFVAIIGTPSRVMDTLLSYPVIVRAVWLLAVIVLAYYKYYLTAVFLAVLGLRIAMDARASYVFSNSGIMAQYSKLQADDPRFAESLDVKVAEGALVADPPRWFDPGQSPLPLLLFPPTLEQLQKVQNNIA